MILALLAPVAAACDPAAWTDDCVDWWLDRGYRPGWTAEDLQLDPAYVAKEEPTFTMQQLLDMAERAHASKAPGASRAEEMLRGMANRRYTTMEVCCAIEDARPIYAKILAGVALAPADVFLDGKARRWSPATLWKLRHAVFARHGRPFTNFDLQNFFYGRDAEGRLGVALAPVAAYDEACLTDADRATLALLTEAEAR
jgi:hypothetical protein